MQQGEIFDRDYYHTSCGDVPYEQAEVWEAFFGNAADNIVKTLAPKTVLDVGCAMGYLVAALRDRGVEAYGIDVSTYAISCVREDVKPFCFTASALEDLPPDMPQKYDLVTTIEVVEHLFENDCELFLSNICSYADDILFSSSPDDVNEKTHFNVQQAEYWAKRMAKLSYFRDLEYDAGYISPQAVRFTKKVVEMPILVETFEKYIRIEKSSRLAERTEWQAEKSKLLSEAESTRIVFSREIEQLNRIKNENTIIIERLTNESDMLENRLIKLLNQNSDLGNRLDEAIRSKEFERQNTAKVQGELAFKILQYDTMMNSASWKLTAPIRASLDCVKRTLFFKGIISLKNHGIKRTFHKIIQRSKAVNTSKKAVERSVLPQEILQKQRDREFNQSIKFSIIVPLYNTPQKFLDEMILSVQGQTYANWELCLADGSTEGHEYVEATCLAYGQNDGRIRYKKLACNQGISGNTNECIEMATGEYIALLDHDDVLHPAALYEMMCAICDKQADFIYTDELVFERDISNPITVHFKPDFATDNLRANNYICHFTAFKRSLLSKVGQFSPAHDGSQDHDMFLKLTQHATHIVHIPKVLYYWRSHSGSVASGVSVKNYCIDAGILAVSDHLKRVGLHGKVESVPNAGAIYRIRYEIKEKPMISIIVHGSGKFTSECASRLQSQINYENYEIIIEKNAENQQSFSEKILYTRTLGMKPVEMINHMAAVSNGKYLLFLDSRMRVQSPDFIEELLMYAQREDVGAVGGKAYSADGAIYHAGILVNKGSFGDIYYGLDSHNMGYMGRLTYPQNLSAVSACSMMVSRADFEEMGGFDEQLPTRYDVDFCLKLRTAGKLIVFTPHAVVRCCEGKKAAVSQQEEQYFMAKNQEILLDYDPYYNSNFRKDSNDFSLA